MQVELHQYTASFDVRHLASDVGTVGDWLAVSATAYAIPDRELERSVLFPVTNICTLDSTVATLTHAVDFVSDADILLALSVPDINVPRAGEPSAEEHWLTRRCWAGDAWNRFRKVVGLFLVWKESRCTLVRRDFGVGVSTGREKKDAEDTFHV
ncbi:hypothetical protein Q1J68_07635 [Pseudomonas pergaminensis]|uniref:hypothetical protein n=1 Tax=Pseudomonas pergaminensis TaxID=2853159 RepID=UPI0034D5DAB4